MKLLIRGCAHSGTRYTAKFLNILDVRAGHETPLQDGMVTWYFNEEARYIKDEDYVYLHQTRDTLRTIDACKTLNKEAWLHIKSILPDFPLDRSNLYKSMYYYYYWNRLIEGNTLFSYPVEEITCLVDILDLFKIDYNKSKLNEALNLSNKVGHDDSPNRYSTTYADLYAECDDLGELIRLKEINYGKVY